MVSPTVSPAAPSPRWPCCTPGPSAVTSPVPTTSQLQLAGRTFAEPRRRGKYLWLPFTDGDAVLAHLGMSGQFRLAAAERPARAEHPGALRLRRRRACSSASSTSACSVDSPCLRGGAELPPEIAHIGRDPFDPEYDLADAVRGCGGSEPAIKRALLDQQLVVRHRQHLRRRGALGGPDALRAADRHDVPGPGRGCDHRGGRGDGNALDNGGTSFDALYVNVNGSSGYFDRSLAAYGREGEPCPRCGTPIRREPFMNRSSYRCPRCQRAPRRPSVALRQTLT